MTSASAQRRRARATISSAGSGSFGRIGRLAGDAQMSAPIGAVESHRDQALGGRQVDAVGIVGEVRPARAAGRADQRRRRPLRREPRPGRGTVAVVKRALDALCARCAKGHDSLAVGRPDRIAVERAGTRELLGLARSRRRNASRCARRRATSSRTPATCRRATSSGETRGRRPPKAAAACRRADPARTAS